MTAWYDGQDARLYVDGVRKAESEGVSFSVKPSAADARYMVIGGDANTSGALDDATMDGRIAGVEVYSAPLSDKDVYRVATRELTALDTMPPLVRVAPEPAGEATVGTAYTAPRAEAVDNSGRVSTMLEVTDPSGAPVAVDDPASGLRALAAAAGDGYTFTARQNQGCFTVSSTAGSDGGNPGGIPVGNPGGGNTGGGANQGGGSAGGQSDPLAATGGPAPTMLAFAGLLLLAGGGVLLRRRMLRRPEGQE